MSTEHISAANVDVAVDFLRKLRPGGPWVLTAITPDGPTTTVTASTADEVAAFVRRYNGQRNIYYSANPTRTALSKKAAKTDIAAIEYTRRPRPKRQ
jgi:Mesyanzhinovviridae DNA primase